MDRTGGEALIATIPFLILSLVALLLITSIPWISLVGVGGNSTS